MQRVARAMRPDGHGGRGRSPELTESAQEEVLAFRDTLLAARAHAQAQAALEAADRIARGTYGICQACGKPIPARRLLAVPLASRCVGCQELRETQDRAA
ncbi:MAG: TraR/DksA family transcriptional regulator [candidate division NC10 bacterium]|nr:TraR/DksA family transcriptional regulator [candidate division NC10 bacterium]